MTEVDLLHGVNAVESRSHRRLGYSGFTSPGGCSRLESTCTRLL